MFITLGTLFAGLLGCLIAACIIQVRTGSYEDNHGFPSMIGGACATFAVTVLTAVAPAGLPLVGIIAPAAALIAGAGCTFLAKPMVEDSLLRRKKARENKAGTR